MNLSKSALLTLFLSVSILQCMEEQPRESNLEDKNNCLELNLGDFENLPNEIRDYIIRLFLEDSISYFLNFKASLKILLDRIRLISKNFNTFEKDELRDFIIQLKEKRSVHLEEAIKKYKGFSKEELNQKLLKLLWRTTITSPINNTMELYLKMIKRLYGYTEHIALKKIIRLIIAGADINIQGHYGITPLIYASSSNDKDIDKVKLLIENYANLDMQNEFGRTALMGAVIGRYTEIAKLLIAKGADVNIQDKRGETALTWAENRGQPEIVQLLESKTHTKNKLDQKLIELLDFASDSLMPKKRKEALEEAVRLIIAGDDINILNKDGQTALMLALQYNYTEIAMHLIENDADLNVKDSRFDWTALKWAYYYRRTKMVELLKSKGAK